MDLIKSKLFLDKINREFSRMSSNPHQIMAIDVDILKSYIRDFYEACSAATPTHVEQHVVRQASPDKPAEQDIKKVAFDFSPERPEPAKPVKGPKQLDIHTPTEPPVPELKKAAPTHVVEMPRDTMAAIPIAAPIITPAPPPPAPPVVTPPPVISTPPPAPKVEVPTYKPSDSSLYDELFVIPKAKELSEKLSQSPIADLKKAFNLNEKLHFPKELFGDQKEVFDHTVDALNALDGFEQAKDFLVTNFVGKYDWSNDKKIETAKKFIKIVHRRYL